MVEGIETGEEDAAVGSADWLCHIGPCEADTLVAKPVEVWGLHSFQSIGAHPILPLLVHEDEKDIGSLLALRVFSGRGLDGQDQD